MGVAMRRLVLVSVVAAALAAVPTTAASPTVRLAIIHWVSGCHVWSSTKKPTARIVVHRGTRLAIRVSCPMDFDFRQTAGPKLKFGPARVYSGTTRTVLFRARGVYRLVGKNVQSSEERGLGTLGADNMLRLTVVVR
jgi:hypothetical protein